MTYTIRPDSPKAVKAQAFARELRHALAARDVSLNELARAVGVGHTAMDHYRAGTVLPRTATARTMAEVLHWPRLAAILVEARTFACARPGCPRTFVNEGGGPKRYCSPSCQQQAATERKAARGNMRAARSDDGRTRRGVMDRLRSAARIADERALAAEAAIAAMCAECEPEGVCRTPQCALRSHSPLPLATRTGSGHARTLATVRREAADRPETIARRSASMRARHAEPGFTDRLAAASRAALATRSPERREAWIDAIRAGKAAAGPERLSAAARKGHETRRRAS